uniref:hypothetical protein n=1 Tax=Ndongobacter massiliensis TaxID=1871025 RepID=UPI0022B25C40|nr:hypothetical protein [Ndongobacter massiliensis]
MYSFQRAKISEFLEFNINNEVEEYSIEGNRRTTENIVNFCNFIRCSDKNIFQSSIRKYKDDKTIIEKFNSLIFQKKNTILKNLFGINDIVI